MNKAIAPGVLLLLLTGCMTLPGSDAPAVSRYGLQGEPDRCERGTEALALSVPGVNVGLDSDRIARRDADSGEITYLKDVRWAEEVGVMVEQRLASDLECSGFTVVSSHHHKLGQAQLICEVRAFNLVDSGGSDSAEVGLSCVLYGAGDTADRAFVTRQQSPLAEWSADSAVAAVSSAWRRTVEDVLAELRP